MANEFDTVSERDLGGLGAGRRIAAVRAVDDVGQSINATPEQIAALAGIDHSLLTEQAVPGEFFIDFDGTKKQVYTSTSITKFTSTDQVVAYCGIPVEIPTLTVIYRQGENLFFKNLVDGAGFIQDYMYRLNLPEIYRGNDVIIKFKYARNY